MREIHWHPTSDEWNFYISGSARMTMFGAPDQARTFDFTEGDVGYVPYPDSHYIENVGDTDVVFLEVLQSPHFSGIMQRTFRLIHRRARHIGRSVAWLDAATGGQGYFEPAG